jgi:hypothetical protein
MRNNKNTKANKMRKTFMVGDKAVYTPVLSGFGKPQAVTIMGVTDVTFDDTHVQGICQTEDGKEMVIHIEHLTHATK